MVDRAHLQEKYESNRSYSELSPYSIKQAVVRFPHIEIADALIMPEGAFPTASTFIGGARTSFRRCSAAIDN